ncbi:MAG: DUF4173 domain-containing protein, partial [Clostridia bacterium]|nr:DUF4173 domain-containing protein [Clostridia bacterium]
NNINLNPQNQYANVVQPMSAPIQHPKKTLREFTRLERVFAWLSFIFGYLFCRAFPVGESPLGGFLFVLILFAVTAIVLKLKGCKFTAMPIALALSAIVVSLSLIISNNSFIYFFAYSYAIAVYCYFVYAVLGTASPTGLYDFILADFFKALFIAPFYSFACLFRGMFSGRATSGGKFITKALLGVAIAILPTSIVLVLLCYDASFLDLLHKIFNFSLADVFSHIFSLGFAIPIGMYIYGLFISSADKTCQDVMTVDECKKGFRSMRIAPVVTILAAAIPVLLVYVVFFISQIDYYVSGFTGYLPRNLSYAQYAREGFFQLCTVSVINLVVILLALMFMKRKSENPPVSLKILTVAYSVFTLVLISTAISKMVMYINYYGLTQRRVYASWFMILLAVIFIIIAVKQFVPKFKAVAVGFVVCVALFAALALPNVDSMIARYNVNRYLDGSLQTIDVEDMYNLGDSAVPEMVRLYDELSESENTPSFTYSKRLDYNRVKSFLRDRAYRLKDSENEVFSFNIPATRARNALRESGFLK